MAEVPQVDGELTQLVVPQIPVSEQDGEQGEGQGALPASALLWADHPKKKKKTKSVSRFQTASSRPSAGAAILG